MSENKKETKNQDMIEKEMKEKMKQTVEDEKIPSSLEPEAPLEICLSGSSGLRLSCSGSSRIYEYERRKK